MDKHTIDVGAALTALMAVMNWMPKVAAMLSAIWYVIRLVEWAKSKLKKDGKE